jgi:hypothetical protein
LSTNRFMLATLEYAHNVKELPQFISKRYVRAYNENWGRKYCYLMTNFKQTSQLVR